VRPAGRTYRTNRYGQDELHWNLNSGQQQFDSSLSKTRLVLQEQLVIIVDVLSHQLQCQKKLQYPQ